MGIHISTVVPLPGVLCSTSLPPDWATSPSTMARPRPVPLPTPLVVKKGSTTRDSVDRKSTRLNSSHLVISYAVFCLKKKKVGHARAQGTPALEPRGDRRRRQTPPPSSARTTG